MTKFAARKLSIFSVFVATWVLSSTTPTFAANQTWDGGSTTDGNWTDLINWVGDAAFPGDTSGGTTNTDVAFFNAAIANTWGVSAANPITIDSGSQNIGGISFTGATGNYFIGTNGANSLLLTSGGAIQILNTLTSTNAVETINAPLVLEGANGTYSFLNNSTSGTGAGAGTLNIGGAISGGAAGATVLTLDGSNTNTNTISGLIGNGTASSVALVKNGAGTWVLTGANTYTGGTTVNAGILQGNTTGLQGNILDNANVTFNQTSTGTYAGAISGSGSVTKLNTGTVTFSGANGYSGATTVNGGVLSLTGLLNSTSALVVGGGTFSYDIGGGSQTVNGATLNLGIDTINAQSGNTLVLGALTRNAGGVVDFNSTTTGAITTSTANVNGIIAPWALFGSGTGGSGSGLEYATGGGTIAGLIGTTAATAPAVIDTTGAFNYDLSAGGIIGTNASVNTLRYIGAVDTITGNFSTNGLMNVGAGALTASGNITIGSNKELVITGPTGITLSGIISNNAGGASSLTYGGTGTLTLSGPNTYGGGTTVSSGTLQGTTTSLQGNITDNANVTFSQTTSGTYAGIISGGGSLTKVGTGGTATLSGVSIYSGVTTITSGTFSVSATGALGTSSNRVGVITVGASAGTTAAQLAVAGGSVFGSDLVMNNGTGTGILLSSGSINLSGTLKLDNDNANNNAFASLTGGTLTANAVTLSRTALNNGTTIQTAGSTTQGLYINGATAILNVTTTLGVGNLSGANSSANMRMDNGSVTVGGTTTVTTNNNRYSVLDINGGTFTENDTLGPGILVGGNFGTAQAELLIRGTGVVTTPTVTFGNATQTAGGNTLQLTGGKLFIGSGGMLNGGSSVVPVIAFGTATLGANADWSSSLAMALTGTPTIQASDSTNTTGHNITLSGVLSSTGAPTKSGAGTLILGGANSYSGVTTISAGTLQIGSPSINSGTSGQLGSNTSVVDNSTLAFDRSDNISISKIISGTGGLNQIGSGTLTLTGASTYTGPTAINAGVLNLGVAQSGTTSGPLGAGSLVGSTISFGGGTLQYTSVNHTADYSPRFSTAASQLVSIDTNGQAISFGAGLTSSNGSLTVSSTAPGGSLTLNGANTYNGATTVNSGTLAVSAPGSLGNTAIGVASGATFAAKPGSGSLTFGTTAASLNLNAGSTFSMVDTGAGTLTLNSVAGGAGTLLTIGGASGTAPALNFELANSTGDELVINNGKSSVGATGATINLTALAGDTSLVSSYTLISDPNGGLPLAGAGFTLGNSAVTVNGTVYNLSLSSSTSTALILSATASLSSPNYYWKGNGTSNNTSWSDVTNFATNNGGGTAQTGANPLSAISNVILTADSATHLTQSLDGSYSINSLTFGGTTASSNSILLSGGSLNLGASASFVVTNAAGTANYGVGTGLVVQAGSAAHTIDSSVNITLGSTQTWEIDNAAAKALTVNASISDGGNNFGITKTGTGTLILGGSNSYGGPTVVNAGALTATNDSALSSSTGTFAGLQMNPASGTATVNFTSLNPAIASLASSGAGISTVVLGNASSSLPTSLSVGSSGASTTFAAVVSDLSGTNSAAIGSLTKIGSGTLTLSGANTYTGGTFVSAGVLKLGVSNALLPTGPLTVQNSGTFDLGGLAQTVGSLADGNTNTGSVTSSTGTPTLTISSNANATYSGVISSGLSVAKTGSSTETLSGANTYSGLTTVSAGELIAASNAALGSATAATAGLSMNPSTGTAIVNFTSSAPAIASLASSGIGSSSVILGNSTLGSPATLTVGGNNASTNFGGVISDGFSTNPSAIGGLVKTGTGALTLSGINTYTGSTTVTVGTIIVPATGSIGAGPATAAITLGPAGSAGGTAGPSQGIMNITGGSVSGTTLSQNNGGTTAGLSMSSGTLTLSGTLRVNSDSANNDGLVSITGGTISTNAVTVGRTGLNLGIAPITTNGSTAEGLYINGAGVSLNITSTLDIGNLSGANSSANMRIDNGTVAVGGKTTITSNNGGRLSIFDISNGSFTSSDSAGGIQIGGNFAGAAGEMLIRNLALVTTNNITFGNSTQTSGLNVLELLGAGKLYVGSGGLQNGGSSVNPTIAVGGTALLGAYASWSSPLNMTLTGTPTIQAADSLGNANNITLSGVVSGAGTLTKTGGGILTLEGANTYSGATTISAGTLVVGDGGTNGQLGNTLAVADNGILAFNRADNVSITNVINGSGVVNQNGSGTTTLTNANTYTGGTNINSGILNAGVVQTGATSGPLGASGSISFGGGTLQYSTANQTDYSPRFSTAASQLVSIDTNGQAISFGAGLTSSNGSLTVSSTAPGGSLTLNSANTYNGSTTINSGKLVVASTSSLGNTAITVSNGGTLLMKPGSGSTTIGTTGASLTLNDGSAFSMQDGAIGTVNLNAVGGGTGTVLSLNGNSATPILDFDLGSTGADKLVINNGTIFYGGTQNTISLLTLGTTAPSVLTNIPILSAPNDTLQLANFSVAQTPLIFGGSAFLPSLSLNGTSNQLLLNLTAVSLNYYWTGTNGSSWATAGDFVANPNGTTPRSSGPTLGSNVFLTANAASNLTSQSLDGSYTANSLNFTGTGTSAAGTSVSLNNGTLTLSAANSYTDAASNNYAVGTGLVVQSGSAAHTINANIVLGATQTWEIDNAAANGLLVNGNISDNNSNFGLTKTGTGTLILNNFNSYGGLTTVSKGVLTASNDGALGNSSSSTSGLLMNPSSGTATVNFTSGNPTIGSLANSGAGTSSVVLGDATNGAQTTLTTGVNNSNTTFSGKISDGTGTNLNAIGAVTKAGTGTMILSGANTFTGGVTLNGGILNAGGAETAGVSGPFGKLGLISFGGGTLQYSAANQFDYSSRFSANGGQPVSIDTNGQNVIFNSALVSSGGSLTKLGSGTLTLNGANTFTNGVSINGGVLALGSAENVGVSGPLGSAGSISFGGGTLQYSGVNQFDYSSPSRSIINSTGAISIDTNGQNVTFANVLDNSNTGGLTKLGSGSLTLSGTDTYGGLTTVSAGTLTANNNAALGSSTAGASGLLMNPANGAATVNFPTAAPAIASLASSGIGTAGVVLGNATAGAATTLTFGGNNASTTYGGTITDGVGTNATAIGSLTKTGSGTLTDNGSIVLAGAAAVNNGLLDFHGATTNSFGAASTITGGTTTVPAEIQIDTGAILTVPALAVSTATTTTTPGVLHVNGGSFTATGTLTINGNNNTGNGNGGVVTIEAGSTTNLQTVNLGTGNFDGAQLQINGGTNTIGTVSVLRSAFNSNTVAKYDRGVIVNGGTTTMAGLNIGTGNSAATLSMTGGTLNISGTFSIGAAATARTSFGQVTGGTLTSTDANGLQLATVVGAAGSFDVNGGNAILKGINMLPAGGSGGSAIATLDTGTLFLGSVGVKANTSAGSTASLVLNGGILGATADWTSTASVPVTIGTPGTIIEADDGQVSPTAHNITIAGSMTGTGPITKNGAGTLTYTGAAGYSGNTTINLGSLKLGAAETLPSNMILNGGSLATSGKNQTLGELVLQTSGHLDLGLGAQNGKVQFVSSANLWSPSTTLTIDNWTPGADHVLFGNSSTALDSTELADINFTGFGTGAQFVPSGNGEIEPLSVPSVTFLAGDVNDDHHLDARDILAEEKALANLGSYASAAGNPYGIALNQDELDAVLDQNHDGVIDNSDVQALIINLTAGQGSNSTVPEPSAFILIGLALPAFWTAARRRHKS